MENIETKIEDTKGKKTSQKKKIAYKKQSHIQDDSI